VPVEELEEVALAGHQASEHAAFLGGWAPGPAPSAVPGRFAAKG